MPIEIKCVSVSALGIDKFIFLCRQISKVPLRPVSMAVPFASPSPWQPWPSPTENNPPSTKIGRKSFAPFVSNLMSRFPPNVRGMVDG